ncbi:Bola3 [Phodopus roborovskii]|uniref:Bola3 protein n=1 Tax=Phodopus roborovskii TaxID=109678 RepID=A0AAV0A499_PHORO|nr:Bola3 [Phodopus roborovskii]
MAAWGPASALPLLRGSHGLPLLHCVHRMFASQTEGELKVTQVLKEKFPRATAIKVTDISGGCGAMYEIKIESEEFKEKRTVQQHQMVNQCQTTRLRRFWYVFLSWNLHQLELWASVSEATALGNSAWCHCQRPVCYQLA